LIGSNLNLDSLKGALVGVPMALQMKITIRAIAAKRRDDATSLTETFLLAVLGCDGQHDGGHSKACKRAAGFSETGPPMAINYRSKRNVVTVRWRVIRGLRSILAGLFGVPINPVPRHPGSLSNGQEIVSPERAGVLPFLSVLIGSGEGHGVPRSLLVMEIRPKGAANSAQSNFVRGFLLRFLRSGGRAILRSHVSASLS
jgi:hypothetical protein